MEIEDQFVEAANTINRTSKVGKSIMGAGLIGYVVDAVGLVDLDVLPVFAVASGGVLALSCRFYKSDLLEIQEGNNDTST